MKKYDIMFDFSATFWTLEKRGIVGDQIKTFFLEWQDEFQRQPIVESVVMGLNVYEILKISGKYNHAFQNIEFYGVVLECDQNWTVNPNYLEINLK